MTKSGCFTAPFAFSHDHQILSSNKAFFQPHNDRTQDGILPHSASFFNTNCFIKEGL